MRELTISEIKKLDNKDTVPAVEGTIKKVFDQKSGESEYGPWHLQNLILCEGENEITMTWGGEESLKPMEGQRVRFECSEGKHGKQGLKWEVRQANGKTYESVKITPTAKITALDSPQKAVSSAAEAPSARPDAPRVSTQQVEAAATPIVKTIKQRLGQLSDGYKLVLAEMHALKFAHDMEFNDSKMSDDQFTKVCNMLFMDLVKSGMIEKLPQRPIDPPKKKVTEKEVREMFTPEKEPLVGNDDF